jgi:RNA polymerase sigma-70 factor (ECF subfamily)
VAIPTMEAVTAMRSRPEPAQLGDEEIVDRVCAGETHLFELLMRRYNQRLYRTARAVLANEAEAEDVVQQAYLNAFRRLDQFEHRARVSTWLTRITIHEALARRRRRRVAMAIEASHAIDAVESVQPDPEHQAYAVELRGMLESLIDGLPASYRCVFMLRAVEGVSTTETAELLQLTEGVVKTRLHRARRVLQDALRRVSPLEAFRFAGARCDAMVAMVMRQLAP